MDPADGQVYAGGVLNATGPHVVGKLDPKTGTFRTIASIDASDLPVLGGPSCFDPATRQLFLQLGVQRSGEIINFAINVDSGAVTQIPNDPETGRILTTFQLRCVHI